MQRAMSKKDKKGWIKILVLVGATILLFTGTISFADYVSLVGGAV